MDQNQENLVFDFDNVEPHIVRESSDQFNVRMGDFDGPLDLLLFLIRREEANIFDIPIAKITDEYLRYIRMMKTFDFAVAADFLVMAATLIEIKSKMLLPPDPAVEGEEEIEDPRQELVDRLLEYQQFKNAAEMLWSRATVEQAVFTRGEIESDDNNLEVSATIFDLFEKFQIIVERHKEEVKMEIKREEMTLAQMISSMRKRLFTEKVLNLLELFEEIKTRHELVLAFISVLEIVRTESVRLTQKKTFGDIILRVNPDVGA
ncbi:MAG: segregation/condensation protein A [Acidobacteria bacterium]|nr:segregation/condensation protein A [Acidobacteriota bacterium]